MTPPPEARSKCLSREEAARAVQRARRKGERVVMTSGCFDLLHVGHVRSLEEARRLGDRLVVALNTDASVRRMKGPTRPLVPARQRTEVIASLACVDWVTTFREATPRATVAALRPDVFAKGGDWPLEVLLANDIPKGLELEVHRLGEIDGVRTTHIVERALERSTQATARSSGNRKRPVRRPTEEKRGRKRPVGSRKGNARDE
ncbi:MAG: adenylyltransferase/cytidyltransferase family protein [Myxococcota bacterium]|nr:adenylyltransferase/cytidyltransferase family protein [Myxococcota bacterium]